MGIATSFSQVAQVNSEEIIYIDGLLVRSRSTGYANIMNNHVVLTGLLRRKLPQKNECQYAVLIHENEYLKTMPGGLTKPSVPDDLNGYANEPIYEEIGESDEPIYEEIGESKVAKFN